MQTVRKCFPYSIGSEQSVGLGNRIRKDTVQRKAPGERVLGEGTGLGAEPSCNCNSTLTDKKKGLTPYKHSNVKISDSECIFSLNTG